MTRLRTVFVLGAAFCLFVLTPLAAGAAPGDLDPTFGTDGIVSTPIGATAEGFATAIQPDGKILAAGECKIVSEDGSSLLPAFCLARYLSDGSLDTSFGGDGTVTTEMGVPSGGGQRVNALLVQPDAKIVAVGWCFGGPAHRDYCLARYNADGSLDTSFGDDGKVITNLGGEATAEAALLQPDGKIVAVGHCQPEPGLGRSCLTRYMSDGSLDPTFGTGGVRVDPLDLGAALPFDAALQPDGKIVVAGACGVFSTVPCLARYQSNGALDSTFGTFGRVAPIPMGQLFWGVAVQSDGKIVAAGLCDGIIPNFPRVCLARVEANGANDSSFGTAGFVITDLGGVGFFGAIEVALQPDGKIIALGNCLCLARYETDGDLDPTFGTGGWVAGTGAGVWDIALQSDRKIVVAGACAGAVFCLARFNGDTPIANQAPTNIALSASSIAENKPAGTTVGSFSTTDPDAGDSHSYSLVAGEGDTDNAAFTIAGGELRTAASLDFETKASYAIRVRSSDGGGLFFEKQFTISVTNVNEAPLGANDSYGTNLGANLAVPVATGVLANDTDPDAGTTLSASLVSGTTHGTLMLAGDGSFLYTPAFAFAGSDGFSYRAGDGSLTSNLVTVTIVVSPPTVITVTPASPTIANGTNQQFTATGTYADGATADLTSAVTWASATPAVATISAGGLAHALAAGTSTISATLGAVSGDTVLTVALTPQTITFDPLADKTYGDPDFAVSATASSGLPVSFAAAGNCTAAGTAVHITGAGSCTITASQPGNASYAAAPSVSRTFSIAKAGQTITFGPLANKRLGDPDFTVAASASSGLAVAFSARGTCTIAGARVHLTGAGSCTITASQAGNANYNAAPAVARTFSIARRVQPRCTVPRVIAKPLAVARSMLAKAHCRTGHVTYVFSRARTRGVVIGQSRRPGRVLPANSKIDLVVSRGRRR